MADLDSLEAELRALGRTLVVEPPAEDLTERVLAALPPTRRRRSPWAWLLARRRRIVAVIIAAVIVGLGLTPPVRAAVVEWLRIGGILIRTSPPVSGPSPTPQPPPRSDPTASLAEAQAKVSFPIGVPDALGAPDRIAVSADRRVVSMDWGSGTGPASPGPIRWRTFLDLPQKGSAAVRGHRGQRARRGLVRQCARDQLRRPRGPRANRAGPDRRTLPDLGASGCRPAGDDAAGGRPTPGPRHHRGGVDPLMRGEVGSREQLAGQNLPARGGVYLMTPKLGGPPCSAASCSCC